MLGLMQDKPLLVSSLLVHAERFHPESEIVSCTCEGPVVRLSYRTMAERVRRLARALVSLGVTPGDRVATMAWNTHRHMELYFAVSGIGAVLHTVNPRLFPEQIEYILNHAESRALFFDITFASAVANLRDKLPAVENMIALTDAEHAAGMPESALIYEELLAEQSAEPYNWPQFDERTASSLCYTSGTTGNPKGVLYSHRSTVLHSSMACQVDGLQLNRRDTTLLAVPLFHVNAWGIPYASALCGAGLVLPGPKLDGKSLFDLAVAERCTFSLGVPTVWLGFLKYIDEDADADPAMLSLERVMIGGSAAPRAIIKTFDEMGVHTIQAWGMTETSPVATVCNLLPRHAELAGEGKYDVQVLQGRPVYGVDIRVVNDDGEALPFDGETPGDLQVRGPWVTSGYFRGEGGDVLDRDGWFSTGDVATIDPDGYVRITDRSKDVIKSGGEWISSIDLENAAVSHPAVVEAAVIGRPHPKWQERPLLIVVGKDGAEVTKDAILDHLKPLVASWWLPDDVVFVDDLPHTATGKLQKMKLREQFKDYELPA
ncbi:long-chain fatty acid--CoA ligase [Hoeflea sp. WL0058]|uniref:3-methylmercaptopropionyl-CoA ligase n=1 Tax=Flavimaribacter sediminis TaxID=2865987 RepID=A0AAE3D3B2_9HYPH|nr:long-chain fatty acid--CoA ligase [Flavimaribacter sediminis]MBW8640689.1 long-chain fatty acid--CoA ligase [Flavimaribacter sediminis]